MNGEVSVTLNANIEGRYIRVQLAETNYLTIGEIQVFGDCDTDDDGTVNLLDLDSDDDGCADALEGSTPNDYLSSQLNPDGSIDLTQTGAGIDADGVPYNGANQGIGESQNHAATAGCGLPCQITNPHITTRIR